MIPSWFLWYGLKIGLSYRQTHAMPLCTLMELITIEQIKNEGFEIIHEFDNGEIIPDLR